MIFVFSCIFAQRRFYQHYFVYLIKLILMYWTEVESRTQGWRSRLRTQKKIRGQGQPFRGQTLSRSRAGMLETKAKDEGHRRKCSSKKKKKKGLEKIFHAISKKKRFSKNFFRRFPQEENKQGLRKFLREISGVFQQTFNRTKNSAVLEPRTG